MKTIKHFNKILLQSKFRSLVVFFKTNPKEYKSNFYRLTIMIYKTYTKRGMTKRFFNSNINI